MRLNALLVFFLAIAPAAMAQEGLTSDTPLGPRDVIDVRILEDASMSGRLTVTDDGQIVMNVVGKVVVAGLTSSQLEAKLQRLLESDYLAKATVSVQIAELASRPISVIGAVVRPGRIGVTGTTTLIQAITQAGGLSANHGKDIFVIRTARNGLTEQLTIDIEQLMVQGNPDLNIPLAPNDLVNVPADTPITIYLMGEVMRPGKATFRSSQTPTLLQALADAGGPTDRAASKVVIRRFIDGKQHHIEVNYRDILKGRRQDEILKDNDTIFVNEAFF